MRHVRLAGRLAATPSACRPRAASSGGILAVVPGQLGIAVFSPPLDARGNSVRGVAVCRDLARDLDLHVVGRGPASAPPLRARHTVARLASKRTRTEAERQRPGVARLAGRGPRTPGRSDVPRGRDGDPRSGGPGRRAALGVLDLGRVVRVEPAAVTVLADLVEAAPRPRIATCSSAPRPVTRPRSTPLDAGLAAPGAGAGPPLPRCRSRPGVVRGPDPRRRSASVASTATRHRPRRTRRRSGRGRSRSCGASTRRGRGGPNAPRAAPLPAGRHDRPARRPGPRAVPASSAADSA